MTNHLEVEVFSAGYEESVVLSDIGFAAADCQSLALLGEQQMPAIGGALMVNPRLRALDEPLQGLVPIIVEELLGVLGNIIRKEGLSAILVEQKARETLNFSDQAIILDRDRIVHEGARAKLAGNPDRLETHLGATEQKKAGSPRRAPH